MFREQYKVVVVIIIIIVVRVVVVIVVVVVVVVVVDTLIKDTAESDKSQESDKSHAL